MTDFNALFHDITGLLLVTASLFLLLLLVMLMAIAGLRRQQAAMLDRMTRDSAEMLEAQFTGMEFLRTQQAESERRQSNLIVTSAANAQRDLDGVKDTLMFQLAELSSAQQRDISRAARDSGEALTTLREQLGERFSALEQGVKTGHAEMSAQQALRANQLEAVVQGLFAENKTALEKRHADVLRVQQEALSRQLAGVTAGIEASLSRQNETIDRHIDGLTKTTDTRLRAISEQVEQRLDKGFEKTTQVFSEVLGHLNRIDEAQKKITELSVSVVSLQEVLSDKRSRGAFGEVQLSGLVANLLPEKAFSLQHTLSNKMRVDCLLFLPDPTGNVAIDAKFPLESYQKMLDESASDIDRAAARRQFRLDIRKHIEAISGKYIIPGETADGAVMFIPAEAVFAEIHAHFPEIVNEAQRRRVWLASPTTMMAILTTARAVLKDEATREQVHIIQAHLNALSGDFARFKKRMDNLARHIRQANKDVDEVSTSAQKISDRFEKIELVELDERPSLSK